MVSKRSSAAEKEEFDHVQPANQNGNRLIGWLVSYGLDKDGWAFELRSGRCLLSSSKIGNEKTIHVEQDDICAPHAALQAFPQHKLVIQDIFSRNGTYISESSSGKEALVDGTVELKHGDWIRVGKDLKFQVCLIDGPSR